MNGMQSVSQKKLKRRGVKRLLSKKETNNANKELRLKKSWYKDHS
jgi:hypothetical protein